jgi:hypothetical protein
VRRVPLADHQAYDQNRAYLLFAWRRALWTQPHSKWFFCELLLRCPLVPELARMSLVPEVNITPPVSSSPSYCHPFMTEYVAELPLKGTTSGLNSVWDIARNQEYTTCSYWGPAALLRPTAPGRAGYYWSGSTLWPPLMRAMDSTWATREKRVWISRQMRWICPPGHYCPENSLSLQVQSPGRLPGICEKKSLIMEWI